MKPGNLSERMMVPNPAATRDEDSIFTHIESVGVRFFMWAAKPPLAPRVYEGVGTMPKNEAF